MLNTAHRQCFLSTSDFNTCLEHFSGWVETEGLNDTIIVSHRQQESSDSGCANTFNWINHNHLTSLLGRTFQAVMLDFSKGVNLSALAILSGTIQGGGILILHLGNNWRNAVDEELARFLPWPHTPDHHPSHYKHIFWQSITAKNSPFSRAWPIHRAHSVTSQIESAPSKLTEDQQKLIHEISPAFPSNHLVLAPRGRGKSFALGKLLTLSECAGWRIMTTASSLNNVSTLRQSYQDEHQLNLPFQAPDALAASTDFYDLLVIDEAASIPLPVLDALQHKASTVVFCTTDFGYEGSGRGFGLRFKKQLERHPKPVINHTLTQPLRWGNNDPFEAWLHQLLFSDYQPQHTHEQCPKRLQGAQWLEHPKLLDQAFALLVSAHYQTKPDNKRWIVDDPSIVTFLRYSDAKLVGVALVSIEGHIPNDLATNVAQGRRRPRGHLLPQSLMAHEGILEAAQYLYWRVSRIAVAPHARHLGHGSALLQEIHERAQSEHVDFVCTSFAATTDVLIFWQRNDFVSVRLGTSKDQASGGYSLMMLRAVTSQAKQLESSWQALFARQWMLCKPLQLRQLEADLIAQIEAEISEGEYPPLFELTEKDVSDLTYFCNHHRPYDTIRAPLLVFSKYLLTLHRLKPNTPDDALLLGCSRNTILESDAQSLGYTGKKAFYQALKRVIGKHLSEHDL